MSKIFGMGRLLVCAALVSPLPGCAPDPTPNQLASCISKSTKNNPADTQATREENHDAIGEDIVACMKQAGYRHTLTDSQCIDDVDFNVHCYARRRS
jgi:hypothetical protein